MLPGAIAGALAGAICGLAAAYFLPAMPNRSTSPDTGPLESRLAAIEKAGGQQPDTRLKSLLDQSAELQSQIAAQRDGLADLNRTVSEAGRASAAAAQSTGADVSRAIAPLSARLQTLEQAGQALAARVTERSAATSMLAAAQALASAFDRGAPLGTEIDTVEAVAGKPELLAALRPFATSGAPGIARLAERFSALRPTLEAATAPAESSLGDRFAATASLIVKVRPAGQASPAEASPNAASATARIDSALRRGDLAGAIGEAGTLSDAARKLAAPWIAEVQKRLAASAAIDRLQRDALAGLAAPAR